MSFFESADRWCVCASDGIIAFILVQAEIKKLHEEVHNLRSTSEEAQSAVGPLRDQLVEGVVLCICMCVCVSRMYFANVTRNWERLCSGDDAVWLRSHVNLVCAFFRETRSPSTGRPV